MIHAGAGVYGCDDPERNRDQRGDQHRRERQLEGGGQAIENRRRHRLIRPQRHAEVPGREALEESGVLHVQRPIEPQSAAQLRDVLRRRALAEHRLNRIARHEMDEREDERRDAHKDRNGEQQPADQEACHADRPRRVMPGQS